MRSDSTAPPAPLSRTVGSPARVVEVDRPTPLEATVIGSWSFPGWYEALTARIREQPDCFGPFDRAEAVEDATRLAIADQVAAGLQRITDGEMTRVDFNLGFYDLLEGLEPLPQERRWGPPAHDQRSKYRCVAPLSAPRGLGTLDEWDRIGRCLPPGTPVKLKMPVPGPFTLAGCIQGGAIYADRRAVTEALIPIVNTELKALVAHGVGFLQLDEPSFACHPGAAHDFLDVIERVLDGVEAYMSLHLCFGNYRARAVGWRSYRPLFPALGRARVNQLALEFASRELAELELLADLPDTMAVAVGVVDVKNTWVEPPELVADRLRRALAFLPPERLSATPDCGFSQTARHIARAKARSLALGAAQVRAEFRLD